MRPARDVMGTEYSRQPVTVPIRFCTSHTAAHCCRSGGPRRRPFKLARCENRPSSSPAGQSCGCFTARPAVPRGNQRHRTHDNLPDLAHITFATSPTSPTIVPAGILARVVADARTPQRARHSTKREKLLESPPPSRRPSGGGRRTLPRTCSPKAYKVLKPLPPTLPPDRRRRSTDRCTNAVPP
jgi:hypothetical protein